MPVVIEARKLVKRYGDQEALKGIDFDILEGECFGFLGPNGAGKTTTIRMIYCYTPLTSGRLSVFGMNVAEQPRRIKAAIGVVPQENNLDPDLTVLENLLVYARYFDIPRRAAARRAGQLLEFVHLTDKSASLIPQLSGGMKRRLMLARALMNQPRLLILDEPTTGLDPQARRLIWQKLRELKAAGTTIVLTTHYMEEAAQLCDRLVIMDRGKILVEGRPDELVEELVGTDCIEMDLQAGEKERALKRLLGLSCSVEFTGDTLQVFSRNGQEVWQQLMDLKYSRLLRRRATLEDLFLKLTGRALRE